MVETDEPDFPNSYNNSQTSEYDGETLPHISDMHLAHLCFPGIPDDPAPDTSDLPNSVSNKEGPDLRTKAEGVEWNVSSIDWNDAWRTYIQDFIEITNAGVMTDEPESVVAKPELEKYARITDRFSHGCDTGSQIGLLHVQNKGPIIEETPGERNEESGLTPSVFEHTDTPRQEEEEWETKKKVECAVEEPAEALAEGNHTNMDEDSEDSRMPFMNMEARETVEKDPKLETKSKKKKVCGVGDPAEASGEGKHTKMEENSEDSRMSSQNMEGGEAVEKDPKLENLERKSGDPCIADVDRERLSKSYENYKSSSSESPSDSSCSDHSGASTTSSGHSEASPSAETDLQERFCGSIISDENQYIPDAYKKRSHEDYFREIAYEEHPKTPKFGHADRVLKSRPTCDEIREERPTVKDRQKPFQNWIRTMRTSSLSRRLSSKSDTEVRRCPQCLLRVRREGLGKHVRLHRVTRDDSTYLCLWCRYTCDTMFELLSHYSSKHFRCPLCKLVSGIQQTRLGHILKCHNNASFYAYDSL